MFCLGGSLFLFDRKTLRYFRKDGHNWRKKKDGKTVKEAHERLKVGKNCYVVLFVMNFPCSICDFSQSSWLRFGLFACFTAHNPMQFITH